MPLRLWASERQNWHPAAYTGYLKNSYTWHCISEVKKFKITIHIEIPKMYLQRAYASHAVFLKHACRVQACTHLGIVSRTFILGVIRRGVVKTGGVLVGPFGLSNWPEIFTTYFKTPKNSWFHGADMNPESRVALLMTAPQPTRPYVQTHALTDEWQIQGYLT